jgi:hypothetical protein
MWLKNNSTFSTILQFRKNDLFLQDDKQQSVQPDNPLAHLSDFRDEYNWICFGTSSSPPFKILGGFFF